jgi:predicted CxxxxCH...CXXCH cytochrome family protein
MCEEGVGYVMSIVYRICTVAVVIFAAGCGSGTGSDTNTSGPAQGATAQLGCTDKCHNASSSISPNPLATNGTGTAGKHVKHVQQRGISCERCHSGYYGSMTHMNGVLDTANPAVNLVSVDIVGPAGSWQKANGQCSGVACHGSATLDWYGTNTWTTPTCTTCHASGFSPALDPEVTNGAPPAGRHGKHVTTRGIACERCHEQYPARTTHMNGRMDAGDPTALLMQFNVIGPAGTWTGDTGAMTGQCANVSCHGTDAVAWYGNSTWSLPASCTTCHAAAYASELDPLGTGGTGTAGKHEKHVTVYGYACTRCHENYPTRPTHANGVVDAQDPSSHLVWFDVTSPTGTWMNDTGPGTGVCSSVSCHGAYSGTFTYYSIGGDGSDVENIVPYAGNGGGMPGWYSATGLGCTDCHGNPPAIPNSTQKYVWHSGSHAGGNDCQLCHSNATGSSGVGTAITNTTLHVNGGVNVQPNWSSPCFNCH